MEEIQHRLQHRDLRVQLPQRHQLHPRDFELQLPQRHQPISRLIEDVPTKDGLNVVEAPSLEGNAANLEIIAIVIILIIHNVEKYQQIKKLVQTPCGPNVAEMASLGQLAVRVEAPAKSRMIGIRSVDQANLPKCRIWMSRKQNDPNSPRILYGLALVQYLFSAQFSLWLLLSLYFVTGMLNNNTRVLK